MAITGATAMDLEFFKKHGLEKSIWNSASLGTQIQWFQQLMPSICGSDCKRYLKSSLFVVGEFGGNDYNAPIYQSGLKYGLRVCCGAGGQGSYNYNNGARCGDSGSGACGDPENYLVWDGIHLTDAAYRSIADGWLNGAYCSPGILH